MIPASHTGAAMVELWGCREREQRAPRWPLSLGCQPLIHTARAWKSHAQIHTPAVFVQRWELCCPLRKVEAKGASAEGLTLYN